MRIYKTLSLAMVILSCVAFLCIVLLLQPSFQALNPVFLSAPISVLSVALVCLVMVSVMFHNSKAIFIKVLKRRGGRVYGELLHHKMKIIDVMDGYKKFVDIEKYIYNQDAFQRVRKFLYEEYFLLLEFEPFMHKTHTAGAVEAFYPLHKELETFIRSISYDKVEFDKFRILYHKTFNKPLTAGTPEEDYMHPEIIEAHDAILYGLEYALSNTDSLLNFVDTHLTKLDIAFPSAICWDVAKHTYDNDFHLWLHAKS